MISETYATHSETCRRKETLVEHDRCKHTAIYGSSGFGKSTALQTIVMSLARKNTPEQVHFNLFDFGTNGLLPLKDLPHTADLARAEDEEKLGKLLAVVRFEVARRKELFTEASVASLGQYEAKTGEKLPVIVTIVDAYDSIKENQNLSGAVDEVLMQLLRDGANVGMYLLITGLRSSTFRMNISGNIPTKIALFLNDASDLVDLVGRDRLPIQEMMGRAQIKLDTARSMQIYIPADGEDDFRRLEALDAEVAELNASWDGPRPLAIPMLPKEIDMGWFLGNREVQNWINAGDIPLGLSMATTEVHGYRPKVDPYFFIMDGDGTQTDYLIKTICEVMQQFDGKYQRILFDGADLVDHKDSFDEVLDSIDVAGFIQDILSDLDARLFNPNEDYISRIFYITNTVVFVEKSGIAEDSFNKLLKEGYKIGIHILMHNDISMLQSAYSGINKELKSSAKQGFVGLKKSEQTYVKAKTHYSEPALEHDEHHAFGNRKIEKVKLVSRI